jgi:hypothetical protein
VDLYKIFGVTRDSDAVFGEEKQQPGESGGYGEGTGGGNTFLTSKAASMYVCSSHGNTERNTVKGVSLRFLCDGIQYITYTVDTYI